MIFHTLECITALECQTFLSKLWDLKTSWVERMGSGIPFYTLGAASYLDAEEKGERYYQQFAKAQNKLLQSHFSPLLEKVKKTLFNHLKKEIVYDPKLALPGFHIFLPSPLFEKPIASIHFDLQQEALSWDRYNAVNFDKTLSFTLPLALPASGGGLNFWPVNYTEEMSEEEIDAYTKRHASTFLQYEIGKLVVHEGKILHQIAASKNMSKNDKRVTLQGHALFCDNAWRVFW